MNNRICVVTGTRAEYGLLRGLMAEIVADAGLELQLVATGAHLSPEYGRTYRFIEQDGFVINEKLEMLLSSDTPVGLGKSLGLATIGFTEALDRLRPGIVVLLGDRYEIFAAAQAALVLGIPVAHIAGGETTEGAIDEAFRHAITKMAHLHFVAADEYRRRVVQLGEDPATVFNFGHPGLENIRKTACLSLAELEKKIGFTLGESYFLVTYHPETLGNADTGEVIHNLFAALDRFGGHKVIITKPNADTNGREIIRLIDEYQARQQQRVYVSPSLGQTIYLSAMSHCSAVIGNSSSGIVEAPLFKKPTVNIGNRQQGRLKASSIVDCVQSADAIANAIELALSGGFQRRLADVVSLYGQGDTARLIKECLKKMLPHIKTVKKFYDLEKVAGQTREKR